MPSPMTESDHNSQNWIGMMRAWQMQEAKARLSEVMKLAQSEGPQDITVHGRSAAVLLSRLEYDRLTGAGQSLAAFMQASPLVDADDVTFRRDRSTTRKKHPL